MKFICQSFLCDSQFSHSFSVSFQFAIYCAVLFTNTLAQTHSHFSDVVFILVPWKMFVKFICMYIVVLDLSFTNYLMAWQIIAHSRLLLLIIITLFCGISFTKVTAFGFTFYCMEYSFLHCSNINEILPSYSLTSHIHSSNIFILSSSSLSVSFFLLSIKCSILMKPIRWQKAFAKFSMVFLSHRNSDFKLILLLFPSNICVLETWTESVTSNKCFSVGYIMKCFWSTIDTTFLLTQKLFVVGDGATVAWSMFNGMWWNAKTTSFFLSLFFALFVQWKQDVAIFGYVYCFKNQKYYTKCTIYTGNFVEFRKNWPLNEM